MEATLIERPMGNITPFRPYKQQIDIFEDLSEKLSINPTQFAFADPGTSTFSKGDTFRKMSPDDLRNLCDQVKNVAFISGVSEEAVGSGKRTSKNHIKKKVSLFFDLDLKDLENGSLWKDATPKEREEEVLNLYSNAKDGIERVLGKPWFVVFSGGGLHLHFWLKNPLLDLEDYKDFYLFMCDQLERDAFSGKVTLDRSCQDIARLARLPGSTNYKSKDLPIRTQTFENFPQADSSEHVKHLLNKFKSQKRSEKISQTSKKRGDKRSDHADKLRSVLTFNDIFDHFHRPFHPEYGDNNGNVMVRSPLRHDGIKASFSVNEDKGVWKDFGGNGDGGDKFELIAKLESLDVKKDFPKVLEIAEEITGIQPETKGQRNSEEKTVTYHDYEVFFKDHLKNAMRCRISRESFIRSDDGRLENIKNMEGVLKSHAYDTGFLKPTPVSYHLERFCKSLPPRLLGDIPEWDGRDRIKEFVSKLSLANISIWHAEYFLKDWLRNVFLRLDNSKIQNRLLLLKGPQGIGKDSFIDAMVSGLGHYQVNLTLSNDPKDDLAKLAERIVLKMPEFDRIPKKETATLKDWITRDEVTFRRVWTKADETYPCVASFIGSTNVNDYLKDYTGNRRFVVFDVESIDWSYPNEESPQILGQALALSKSEWGKNEAAEEAMNRYVNSHTPSNPDDDLVEAYLEKINLLLGRMPTDDPSLDRGQSGMVTIKSSPETDQIMDELASDFKWAVNTVRSKLKRFQRRTKAARFWSNMPLT